jgi:SAM-dependent methyltransferase
VLASLGRGNPTAIADLHDGETPGPRFRGGIDVLLSARRVGPTGHAYGLDMTDEMLDLARANAAAADAANVDFPKGHMEAITLPDASVDIVISNCVVNVSPDKPAVFAEIHRVVRPGGRFGISDLVADDNLTPDDRARMGTTRTGSPAPSPAPSTPATSATPDSPRSSSPKPHRRRWPTLHDHPSHKADHWLI